MKHHGVRKTDPEVLIMNNTDMRKWKFLYLQESWAKHNFTYTFLCVSMEFMLHSITVVPCQQEWSVLSNLFQMRWSSLGNKCLTICRTLRCTPSASCRPDIFKTHLQKMKKYLGKTVEKNVLNGLSLTSLQQYMFFNCWQTNQSRKTRPLLFCS